MPGKSKGDAEGEKALRSPHPKGRSKKLGQLTAKQWWSVIFFTSFVFFHALNPLRHFVLYPSNPSWTEEGHFSERPTMDMRMPSTPHLPRMPSTACLPRCRSLILKSS